MLSALCNNRTMNKIMVTISSGRQYNAACGVFILHECEMYSLHADVAKFRQELLMNLGWEILLRLSKKSDACEITGRIDR